MMEMVHIYITIQQKAWLKNEINHGKYKSNMSEVVRELIVKAMLEGA